MHLEGSGLSSSSDIVATVRTTTPTPDGRAGLAYAALKPSDGLMEPSHLFGLRQNDANRSNIAVENMGTGQQGDISLRLTVFSGDVENPTPQALPDVTLAPGECRLISGFSTRTVLR